MSPGDTDAIPVGTSVGLNSGGPAAEEEATWRLPKASHCHIEDKHHRQRLRAGSTGEMVRGMMRQAASFPPASAPGGWGGGQWCSQLLLRPLILGDC